MTLAPRVVVIHRRTELDALLARHGTRAQAAFFLRERGRDIAEVEQRAAAQAAAMTTVAAAVPPDWRRGVLERGDLDRFLFAPDDVVVAVGQDGLVANVAKYLTGQPVIGVNPDPGRNPGVLVRHPAEAVADMLAALDRLTVQRRVMVRVRTDDGQELRALNEIYIGHRTHQSARYVLTDPDRGSERQSSSGLLVGTGTGATGWCRSVWHERARRVELPGATQRRLCWFVREAWPSPATGTGLTAGALADGAALTVTSETDGLVAFGDGMEADALHLSWGQRATVTVSPTHLVLC